MEFRGKDIYVSPSKQGWIMILVSVSALLIAWFSLQEAQNTSKLTKTQIDLIYQELKPNIIAKNRIDFCPLIAPFEPIGFELTNEGSLPTTYSIYAKGKNISCISFSDSETFKRYFDILFKGNEEDFMKGTYIIPPRYSCGFESRIGGRETVEPNFLLYLDPNLKEGDEAGFEIGYSYETFEGEKINFTLGICEYKTYFDYDKRGNKVGIYL